MAPEKDPKSFGMFEKQAPGQHRHTFILASTHNKKSDMHKRIFLTDPVAHSLAVVTVTFALTSLFTICLINILVC